MINNSRYSVAIHSLMMIAAFEGQRKITSNFIAESTGMNPVTIRKVFSRLKEAGLILIKPGPGGAKLAMAPQNMTLLDIYAAVEDSSFSELFHFSQNNSAWCPVGRHINNILTGRFENVAEVIRKQLSSVTLLDLLNDLDKLEPQLKAPPPL